MEYSIYLNYYDKLVYYDLLAALWMVTAKPHPSRASGTVG